MTRSSNAASAPSPDRSAPPPAGEPRPFSFPGFERRRLEGGPEVILAPWGETPLVCLEILTPAGAEHEEVGRRGLAHLVGEMLDEATTSSSAEELARRADRLGSSLSTGAGWHAGYLNLQVLNRHVAPALELMAEVLTSATFPAEDLERLRREQLADLLQRRDRPSLRAQDRLHRVLYGDSSYGSPLQGTREDVSSLTREDLLGYYRDHYHPAGATLMVLGNFEAEPLLESARGLLGGSGDFTPPEPKEVEPLPRHGITVHVLDRPGAAQTELRVGHAGISRLHPDFVPFSVANAALGGKFTSRINLNLRERHGFTYGANSRLQVRRGPAPFMVAAAVATESTGAATREVLHELRRLRQEPLSQEELEDTKSYMSGVFPYTLRTLEGVVQRLENITVFGLPDDHYDHYLEELLAVSRDDALEAAREHIHPEEVAVVAAGPAEELRPQLEELGPVEVVDRE